MRRDALAIWHAGLAAVRADALVRDNVHVLGRQLQIGTVAQSNFGVIDLSTIGRILVVGAGKAGAAMAAGLEESLGPRVMDEKQLTGWVHVPENCVRRLTRIQLHGARPAGVNEPSQAGVDGAENMLRRVAALQPDDLCIALISGGGSALLPLPIDGVTLDDKRDVTRFLSAAGAPIEELNTVRKQLSQIKGGGLARACRAGRLFTLVISDVLGDPLDLIASGPTVEDGSTPQQAIDLLEQYGARTAGISPRVFHALEARGGQPRAKIGCRVTNLIIGNNARAVHAGAAQAATLGYTTETETASASEGPAEEVGRRLADAALRMRDQAGPDCLISGGEPTVKLVESARRGRGGRNQQLVLAAVERLQTDGGQGVLILSGGTDGEDGPTDAAGALADARTIVEARTRQLDPADYLQRNDAYHWFQPLSALLITGPTDTNVCDLRLVLVDREQRTR